MRLRSYLKPVAVLSIMFLAGLLLWYVIDPDAGKQIKTLADYIGAGLVIILFIWIALTGKHKRKNDSDRYYDYNDNAERRNRSSDNQVNRDSDTFDRNDDNDFDDD